MLVQVLVDDILDEENKAIVDCCFFVWVWVLVMVIVMEMGTVVNMHGAIFNGLGFYS